MTRRLWDRLRLIDAICVLPLLSVALLPHCLHCTAQPSNDPANPWNCKTLVSGEEWAEEGYPMVLNCTLTPHCTDPAQCNISAAYFRHINVDYRSSADGVQVLSDTTAQLTMIATLNMTGHVYCLLNSMLRTCPNSVSMHVARMPLTPVIRECRVRNSRELVCDWTPTAIEQHLHTGSENSLQQHLWMRRSSDPVYNQSCTPVLPTRADPGATHHDLTEEIKVAEGRPAWCYVPLPAGGPGGAGGEVCVRVTAKNVIGRVVSSEERCFDPTLFMVPPAPSNLASTTINATTVRLSWQRPPTSYPSVPLSYTITYSTQWTEGSLEAVVNESTSYDLAVIPYTDYRWALTAKPIGSGYVSNSSLSISFRSMPSEPCAIPDVLSSSFSLSPIEGVNLRALGLYWKPIDPSNNCGPELSYEVRYQRIGAFDWSTMLTDSNVLDLVIDDAEYLVQIGVRNQVGRHRDFRTIRVPSNSSQVAAVVGRHVFAEGQGSDVYVHWIRPATSGEDGVVASTLFACVISKPRCTKGMSWWPVDGRTESFNLSLNSSFSRFDFGVSFTTKPTSAELYAGDRRVSDDVSVVPAEYGIVWMDCLYSMAKPAEVPRNFTAMVISNIGHGELHLSWRPFTCSKEIVGYARELLLYFCRADANKSCNAGVKISELRLSMSHGMHLYRLTGLDHGVGYMLWLRSVSLAGRSELSNSAWAVTTVTWASSGALVAVIFGLTLATILIAAAFCFIYKYCHKCRNKFESGIAILMPDGVKLGPKQTNTSSSSQAPILGYNQQVSYSITRQVSRISNYSNGGSGGGGGSDCPSHDVSQSSPLLHRHSSGGSPVSVFPGSPLLTHIPEMGGKVGSDDVFAGGAGGGGADSPPLGSREYVKSYRLNGAPAVQPRESRVTPYVNAADDWLDKSGIYPAEPLGKDNHVQQDNSQLYSRPFDLFPMDSIGMVPPGAQGFVPSTAMVGSGGYLTIDMFEPTGACQAEPVSVEMGDRESDVWQTRADLAKPGDPICSAYAEFDLIRMAVPHAKGNGLPALQGSDCDAGGGGDLSGRSSNALEAATSTADRLRLDSFADIERRRNDCVAIDERFHSADVAVGADDRRHSAGGATAVMVPSSDGYAQIVGTAGGAVLGDPSPPWQPFERASHPARVPLPRDRSSAARQRPPDAPRFENVPDRPTGNGHGVVNGEVVRKSSATGPVDEGGAIDDGTVSERQSTQWPLAERALGERASADRAAADNARVDIALSDKASANRALADKPTADRALTDKALADRAVADRAVADRTVVDRAVADRPVSERRGSPLKNGSCGSAAILPADINGVCYEGSNGYVRHNDLFGGDVNEAISL